MLFSIQKSNGLAFFCATDCCCFDIPADNFVAATCCRELLLTPTAGTALAEDGNLRVGEILVGSIVRSCCRFNAAALSRCCFGGTSGTDWALLMNRCSAARSAAFFESEVAVTARRVVLRLRVNKPPAASTLRAFVSPPRPTASHKKSSCSAIGTSSSKIRVDPVALVLRRFCFGVIASNAERGVQAWARGRVTSHVHRITNGSDNLQVALEVETGPETVDPVALSFAATR